MNPANKANNDAFPPLPGDAIGGAKPSNSLPHLNVALREEEAEVVRPTVERAILLSSQHDPTVLGAALASVVGTAFRQSITGIFRRAIIYLNRFLVHSFSMEGIRWRFESIRTGKPFQQVVREHSLTHPVTQVFLIHRRTGLMIGQAEQDSSGNQDGDMVSSMLTAIQDFVHDSFRTEAAGHLEVIRIGDVTVLLEQGPLAILAGIITQGFAPQNLRQTFRRALEQIHEDYHDALVRFKGDAEQFEDIQPVLEACLKTRLVKGEDTISPLTGMVLLVPLIVLGVWGFFEVRESARWNEYLVNLEAKPGLMVVDSGRRGINRYVRGLRDPLVADPVDMLLEFGIDPSGVSSDWLPYQSLDPTLVLDRVRRTIRPPDGISLELRNGTLFLEGSAPWQWVEELSDRVGSLQGISRIRSDGVHQVGAEQRLAWEQYLTRLSEAPGILVLEKGRWKDSFYIAGMRDPLAPDPVSMLSDVGLREDQVRSKWEPFQALHPTLVIARANRMLAPSRSVTMALDGDVLKIEGAASHEWISEATLIARGIAGISRCDTVDLQDRDLQAYQALLPLFEEQVFYYLVNRQNLWPGQETHLQSFVANVREFSRISRRLGGGYHIEVRGHTRASGDDDVDASASLAVAERFYSLLQRQQVDMELFTKRGMGGVPAPAAAKADAQKREAHVSFAIITDE